MALPSLLSRSGLAVKEEVEQQLQYVTFRIGSEDFGVDILMVQEIIRLPKITPIPNAPAFILGVINLRGKIIPVIDLRQRLRIRGSKPNPDDRSTRILIVELFNHLLGFIVDSVSEVLRVAAGTIEATPHLVISTIEAEYIKGVIKLPNRLVMLLDFARVLKPKEEKEIDEMDLEQIEEQMREDEEQV